MNNRDNFKLFLPALAAESNNNISLISVDIRQDKTVVGHFVTQDKKVFLKEENSYDTSSFASISAIINEFLKANNLSQISKIAVAVPGPVINGKSAPQRLPWKVDAEEIKHETLIENVFLINDLEASAYGLGNSDDRFLTIHDSPNSTVGNVAILSPGAGLGEAGLYYDGECLRPFATEGGHCEFSPRTNDEVEFYQFLQKIYGIVSWESVLSTAGLFNVYRFLRDVKQQKQPEWLTQEIEAGNFTEAIINGALTERDRICNMTIDTFIIFLAREANSLVLKLKATGGLFLTGEIPMMLEKFLHNEKFYKNFIISDKMDNLLQDIPIYLLKDEKTIINGAAMYAAFFKE